MPTSRASINKRIGRVLGFRPRRVLILGKEHIVWDYPEDWYDQRLGNPEYCLPDFVSVLKCVKALMCQGAKLQRDFDTRPTSEDLKTT